MVVPEVRLVINLDRFDVLRMDPAIPLISQTAQFIAEKIHTTPTSSDVTRGLPQAVDALVCGRADDPAIVEAERSLLVLRQHTGIVSTARRGRLDVDRDMRTMMLRVFLSIPATTIALSTRAQAYQPPPATAAEPEPVSPAPTTSMLRRRMRFRHEGDDR